MVEKEIVDNVTGIEWIVKFAITVFFIPLAKFMILVKDKKTSKSNAILSFFISLLILTPSTSV